MSQETQDEPVGGTIGAPSIGGSGGIVKKLDRLAYRLFGGYFKKREDRYAGLRKKINQARMEVGYDMYLARITFYSLVTGIVGALLGLLITWVLVSLGVLDTISLSISLPGGLANVINEYKLIISGFFITVIFTAILGGITGGILYYIPSFYAGERRRKIDSTLPHAVTFMYALSRGGMNIIEVMDNLASADDVYGEVAKEFDMILRDMDYFGSDLRIALRNASDVTPSDNLSDFLDDLLSVIDSGGEMTPFLLNKSEQYHEIRKQDQKGFLDTLALMAESYVTAFVAAPLFIIIITTIMSVLGGANLMQIYAIVYFVLPVASIGFAVVIDMISTGSDEATEQLEEERDVYGLDNIKETAEGSDDPRFKQLIRAKKTQSLKEFMRDPLAGIKENPLWTLGATVPLAFLTMIIMALSGAATPSLEAFKANPIWNTTALVVIPLMMVTVPLSFFHELKKRREKKIIRELPETLKKLSSANETGMTLGESLLLVSQTSSGVLATELKKVHNEIKWKADLNGALISFANRVKISRLSRTVKLITKANESSGNIRGVLEVAARDVDTAYRLDRERFQNMIIYTVIIIISFLVFLFVIVILDNSFLSQMAEAAGGGAGGEQASQAGGQGGSSFNIESVPIDTYRMVFFHAGIIQAYASGLVAGQMGEDDILSGLKYSIVMTLVALAVFTFI